MSFKGVLLEGLEVALIVISLGASQHQVGIAAAAAAAAVVVVTAAATAARAPLSRVPENNLKFSVGVLLTSFGAFWAVEGAGATWPGDDLALPPLIAAVLLVALGMTALLRSRARRASAAPSTPLPVASRN